MLSNCGTQLLGRAVFIKIDGKKGEISHKHSTFLLMQTDSSLQHFWSIIRDVLLIALSCHTQARSDDVSTHCLTEDAAAQASTMFFVALTSIWAIVFWKGTQIF